MDFEDNAREEFCIGWGIISDFERNIYLWTGFWKFSNESTVQVNLVVHAYIHVHYGQFQQNPFKTHKIQEVE